MGMQSQTFTTETGAQALLAVSAHHAVSVLIVTTDATDDIDIEVVHEDVAKSGVTRHKLKDNATGGTLTQYLEQITTPIKGIGINIVTNNSSDIKVFVSSGMR